MKRKLCVICLEGVEDHFWRSGSPKLFPELEEHLIIIFFLRQLLQLPAKECEALMTQEVEGGRSGNPGDWCCLCGDCLEVVEKAVGFHGEMLRAVRKIQGLASCLKEKMEKSWEVEDQEEGGGENGGVREGHERIREYFRENCHQKLKKMEADLEEVDNDDLHVENGGDGDVSDPEYLPWMESDDGRNREDEVVLPDPRRKVGRPRKHPLGYRRRLQRAPRKRGRRPVGYSCDNCDFTSADRYVFMKHQRSHFINSHFIIPSDSTNLHECKICSEEVDQKNTFSHMKTKHRAAISSNFPLCHVCSKTFSSVSNLTAHVRSVHAKKEFRCAECGATFGKKSERTSHIKKIHLRNKGREKSLICEECGLTYSRPDVLRSHLIKMHNLGGKNLHFSEQQQKRLRKCKHCELQLANDHALKLHVREAHAELYRHKCDECDAMYLHLAGLDTHKKSRHSKEAVECPNCGVKVKCKAYLVAHLKLYCKNRE